jgi:hypothetical protein
MEHLIVASEMGTAYPKDHLIVKYVELSPAATANSVGV